MQRHKYLLENGDQRIRAQLLLTEEWDEVRLGKGSGIQIRFVVLLGRCQSHEGLVRNNVVVDGVKRDVLTSRPPCSSQTLTMTHELRRHRPSGQQGAVAVARRRGHDATGRWTRPEAPGCCPTDFESTSSSAARRKMEKGRTTKRRPRRISRPGTGRPWHRADAT